MASTYISKAYRGILHIVTAYKPNKVVNPWYILQLKLSACIISLKKTKSINSKFTGEKTTLPMMQKIYTNQTVPKEPSSSAYSLPCSIANNLNSSIFKCS